MLTFFRKQNLNFEKPNLLIFDTHICHIQWGHSRYRPNLSLPAGLNTTSLLC